MTAFDSGAEGFNPAGVWHLRSVTGVAVPAGTRKIRVRFLGQRVDGTVCSVALDTVSASFTDTAAPLKRSAVYENRLYRCIAAGTTAAEQPAYDTTIGAETTDGSAVFVAENAWSRAGTVLDVLDRATFTVVIDEPRAGAPGLVLPRVRGTGARRLRQPHPQHHRRDHVPAHRPEAPPGHRFSYHRRRRLLRELPAHRSRRRLDARLRLFPLVVVRSGQCRHPPLQPRDNARGPSGADG